jgi:DNA repair protein RadC
MRTRLLSGGPDGLADYELLEMLLFFSIPRRDTKPTAKAVINAFGDLLQSLQAKAAELRRCGLDDSSIGVVELVREAARRLALTEAVSRPLLNDIPSLTTHLGIPARLRQPPHLAVLLLNNRNQLLAEMSFVELQDAASVTRAVGTRAVESHATALILATIRPDGPLTPNGYDRALTHSIQKAGKALSITLHDHMIFGPGSSESLRRLGMI